MLNTKIWILTLLLNGSYVYADGGVFRHKGDCEKIQKLIVMEEGSLICRAVTIRED